MARHTDEVLAVTGLDRFSGKLAGELAYGYQKRLGVAIGLATRPTLLLLDEPAAGLNQEECAEFGRLLKRLRNDYKLTLLFVEHHMALVMDTCERIVVLVQGRKIAEGTFPSQVRISVNGAGWRESDIDRWIADPAGWRATNEPTNGRREDDGIDASRTT